MAITPYGDLLSRYSNREDWRDLYAAYVDDKMTDEDKRTLNEYYISDYRLTFAVTMKLISAINFLTSKLK